MENLKNREILDKLITYLDIPEILVLHGARQVGKTSIMKLLISRLEEKKHITFYFDLENPDYLQLFNSSISEITGYINSRIPESRKNEKLYIFIDEIQYLNNPTSILKQFYDHYKEKNKLIVSGSSSFAIKSKFKDSLVGRILDFEIKGLSFAEFLNFKNLNYVLNSNNDIINKELKSHFAEYVTYGYYPQIVKADNIELKKVYLNGIIEKYLYKDIRDFANIRNIDKFNSMIRILANQSGQLLNVNELSATTGISRNALEEYLFILENTFIINLLKPYYRNIRNELSKMPKIYFEDTGLMSLLCGKIFSEKPDGHILENSVYNMLSRILGKDDIKYWRTASKQEVDFIVNSKSLYAIEVKLSSSIKNQSGLKSFTAKYESAKPAIITLDKSRIDRNKDYEYLFPWEIYNIV